MSDTTDDMESYSGMLDWAEDSDYELLEKKLRLALWALKKINQIELNSQRPGGGFSESAKLSYNVLNKINRMTSDEE